MIFKLPISQYEVILYDWIPQKVYEDSQNAILGNAGISIANVTNITDDDILSEMGVDFMHKINKSTLEKQNEMRELANRKIIQKRLEGRVTFQDQVKGDRIKLVGMILELKKDNKIFADKEEIRNIIEMLPTTDYALIQSKIHDIEKGEEERKKESGVQ